MKHREMACEILAAFMKGDRTVDDLVQMVGCSVVSARRWVEAMRDSGLVHLVGADPRSYGTPGAPRMLYRIQRSPFEMPDAKR